MSAKDGAGAPPTAEAEDDARIGAIVAGKYRVESPIGRGGMGAVYRAMLVDLGEPVAIKFLHPIFASTPELRARFRREAVALARLRHRGIVSILDFGEHEGEPFMAMELVRGESLADKVAEGPLGLPFIATVFDQLLEVLEVAHGAGVVHRDLKPSNVMVGPHGEVKLLDFGLVKLSGGALEKLTETGMVHGTPEYMAPEQCEGKDTSPATDVYSLGVMLYECVAGKTPFRGGGGAQLMAAHLFVDPPPLVAPTGPVPRALDDLTRRCLAKAPEARPTASGVRQELAAIFRGTDPVTMAEAASRERSRDAALGREERALTGRGPASERGGATASPRVELRIANEDRASSLERALAVAGVRVVAAGASEAAGAPDVVVVSIDDGITAVERAVREGAATVVVDVRELAQVRDCVRAGATDILVVESADAELAGRIPSLVRRPSRRSS